MTFSFYGVYIQIIPENCRYEVLSTKVEIRLAKADVITWPSLEHGKGPAVLPKPNVSSGFLPFLVSSDKSLIYSVSLSWHLNVNDVCMHV